VTYTVLALIGVGGAALVDQAVWRTNLLRRKAFWTAYGLMLFFQLVVNGVLTGLPVVRYDRQAITGVRFVNAPVEDLLFGFAMIVLTLSTWVWLGRQAIGDGSSTRR
jgi:lycopene cyclase domain-containing protein